MPGTVHPSDAPRPAFRRPMWGESWVGALSLGTRARLARERRLALDSAGRLPCAVGTARAVLEKREEAFLGFAASR